MPHLSELHGAATHLAVVALPLLLVLLGLRRLGRGGDLVRLAEPWVLGAAAAGIAASGLTGLLVRGESQTELRGGAYDVGGIHFWLGIGLAALVVVAVAGRVRQRGRLVPVSAAAMALAFAATSAVLAQGYLGGRMTYEHGVGVQALGQGNRTAAGAVRLAGDLAHGMPAALAGDRAFGTQGLGCASCHGALAQGARGPRLAGGRDLEDFRRVHAGGLFPADVVTDRDFRAIHAYLESLG